MRLIVTTRARADTSHQTDWGHKLRGRIYRALDGTSYAERHDSNGTPGWVSSCPTPFGDANKGEHRTFTIASPDEGLLEHIQADLDEDSRLTIGEWDLDVINTEIISVDAGTPGTRGVLSTVTGVHLPIPNHRLEKYGIEIADEHRDTETFWRPEMGTGAWREQVRNNLDLKHRLFHPDHLPGPCDVPDRIFDGLGLIKSYCTPYQLAEEVEYDLILSKWHLAYTVRGQDHRRHLNLALDCGIGERNPIGLGMLDRLEPAEAAVVLGMDSVDETEVSAGTQQPVADGGVQSPGVLDG
jgi:CRISPR-associated endoribonuclease Cas6